MADAPARAWRVVLEKIESDLLEGVLRPGDHLPPERELAAALGVGRSSVREALRVLDVLGLIRTATGSGPASGAIVIATPHGGMAALLRLQVAARGFAIEDVVRTRLILETAVAGSLAREAEDARLAGSETGEELAEARGMLAAMEMSELSPAEFLALDARFHTALAEASGNSVVAAMMAGLRTSIESYVIAGAERVGNWAATADRLRAQHREIIDAIAAGDSARATRLVHDHITGYYAQSGLTAD
ncbi:FCD domain-containing protein [Microbacterium kribbense]|uniref:FCD domain-containing protein n=1 Tax=Microbacterium kribbense TaxID=433645 RepID=A0ABP7GCC1_9MICO